MLELDPHGIEPECRSWGQDTELLIQICALGMPSRIKSGNLVEQNSLLKKPNRSSGVTAFAEELPGVFNKLLSPLGIGQHEQPQLGLELSRQPLPGPKDCVCLQGSVGCLIEPLFKRRGGL
jgi:hypothetical protein